MLSAVLHQVHGNHSQFSRFRAFDEESTPCCQNRNNTELGRAGSVRANQSSQTAAIFHHRQKTPKTETNTLQRLIAILQNQSQGPTNPKSSKIVILLCASRSKGLEMPDKHPSRVPRILLSALLIFNQGMKC